MKTQCGQIDKLYSTFSEIVAERARKLDKNFSLNLQRNAILTCDSKQMAHKTSQAVKFIANSLKLKSGLLSPKTARYCTRFLSSEGKTYFSM